MTMHRLGTLSGFLLLAIACGIAASANGATSNVVVSMEVPSATSLTNDCRSTSATRFGTVLPGTAATTATGAGACSVSFSSSNDTAALRLATLDGASVAMSSPSAAWATGRTGGMQVRAIDRANANTIVIGAWWGLAARSIDGGATWDYDYGALPSGDYVSDVDHVPGSDEIFVAVGGRGSISSSTNVTSSAPANPTWVDHRAQLLAAGWPAGENVTGVAVVDALTWYVVGESGGLARTSNGGTSFTYHDVPLYSQILGIDALDANTIYATGSNGRIYYTTTGEANLAAWSTAVSTCNCRFFGVSIADPTHVYVASDSGLVARFDGTSFVEETEVDERIFEPRAVHAPPSDPDTVFVAGMYGKVFRSDDGAATFTRTNTPVGGALRSVHALSDTDVIAAGSSETVVRSTDAGASWSIHLEDTGHRSLRDVQRHPSDGQRALAVGARGTILRTTDGATSWSAMTSGTSANLNGVAWPSSGRAVAVGAAGTIVVSTDGGATWSPRSSGTTAELLAVSAGDHETLWAVGTGGTILRSSNRGDTWSAQASGSTQTFEGVEASGTQAVVVTGHNGTVRYTANGGGSWAASAGGPPGWESVTGAAARDDTTIYVSTLYSGLYRSTDGGATFAAVGAYPAGSIAADAVEALDDTIVAVSRSGDVAISRDAGASWTLQASFALIDYDQVIDLELVDPHTFIVVDNNGMVRDQDENSLAASQVADYSGGSNFASGDTTGAFGVCLQSLTNAAPAGSWVADGGTCTAVDSDPWKAVPTAPQSVATSAAGASADATFVWGLNPRSDQPAGVYRAGVVFEAVAPAA